MERILPKDKSDRLILLSAGLLLVLFTVLSYWKVSVTADYFAFDSYRNIAANDAIKIENFSYSSLKQATQVAEDLPKHRPVAFISFAINYYFSKLNPVGYRLTNVAILSLCGIGLMFLSYLVLTRFTDEKKAMLGAILAAAIWTLHPFQTNMTTYIVQRMTSLAILGYMWGFVFFILGEKKSRLFWILTAACFFFGVFSKEIAVFLPVAIIAYKFAWDDQWLPKYRNLLPFVVTAVVLGIMGVATWYEWGIYQVREFNAWERFYTESRVLWHYLYQFMLPFPWQFNLDYEYMISTGLFKPWYTIVAMLMHLMVVASSHFLWRRNRLLAILIVLYYVHHFLEGTFVPLELVFEHRMCLPGIFLSLGLAYATTMFFDSVAKDKEKYTAGMLALSLVTASGLGFATYRRNKVWEDEATLLEDILEKSPHKPRVRQALTGLYISRGRVQDAERIMRTSPGGGHSLYGKPKGGFKHP